MGFRSYASDDVVATRRICQALHSLVQLTSPSEQEPEQEPYTVD